MIGTSMESTAIIYKHLGLKADPLPKVLKELKKQINDAFWEGKTELAIDLEKKAAMIEYKLSIGETHDVPF